MTSPTASIPLVSSIFGLTYLAMASGRFPACGSTGPGSRWSGAAAMLACGVLDAAGRGQGRRLRDDRPALRHDGRRGLPPYGRLLRPRDRADRRAVLRPFPAGGDDRAFGRAFGVPGQRRGLRRADAAGPPPLPAAEAPAHPLPRRPGDGVERRLGRHDHGKPAKHHHWLTLADILPAVRRAAGPGRADRPGAQLRRRGPGLSQGPARIGPRGIDDGGRPRAAGPSAAARQERRGDPGHGRRCSSRGSRSPWWRWPRPA